ncbi:MAG: hypothetical protein ABH837_00135 [bacterium]
MEIKWHGGSLVSVKTGFAIVYFDYSIDKLPEPDKYKQIIVCTIPNDINPSLNKHKDRFIINQPGEYEISGVEIRIIPVNNRQIAILKYENNTLASFNLDTTPSDKVLKLVNGINILLLSVGKNNLDIKSSSSICNQVEPQVLIPIDYQELKEIDLFLKNENFNREDILDKYQFSKSDLNTEERQNVLLKPQK